MRPQRNLPGRRHELRAAVVVDIDEQRGAVMGVVLIHELGPLNFNGFCDGRIRRWRVRRLLRRPSPRPELLHDGEADGLAARRRHTNRCQPPRDVTDRLASTRQDGQSARSGNTAAVGNRQSAEIGLSGT